jgi:hypothetical protein
MTVNGVIRDTEASSIVKTLPDVTNSFHVAVLGLEDLVDMLMKDGRLV